MSSGHQFLTGLDLQKVIYFKDGSQCTYGDALDGLANALLCKCCCEDKKQMLVNLEDAIMDGLEEFVRGAISDNNPVGKPFRFRSNEGNYKDTISAFSTWLQEFTHDITPHSGNIIRDLVVVVIGNRGQPLLLVFLKGAQKRSEYKGIPDLDDMNSLTFKRALEPFVREPSCGDNFRTCFEQRLSKDMCDEDLEVLEKFEVCNLFLQEF